MSLSIAHIVPTPNLLALENQTVRMMLAHITNADYRNYYSKVSNTLILDNGLYENSQVTQHDLLELMYSLLRSRPSNTILEVIAPDTLYDYRGTTKKTKDFLEVIAPIRSQYRNRLRVMGVPQGKSPDTWLKSATDLVSLGVDTIGLSKLSCPRSFKEVTGNEDVALNRLVAYSAFKTRIESANMTIHLLGAGNPHEFRFYKGDHLVRSCDTAMAALLVSQDKYATMETYPHLAGGEHKTKLDFDKRLSETMLRDNMAKINEFAKV